MLRRLSMVPWMVIVLAGVIACGTSPSALPTDAPATYELPPRTVRPNETALKIPPTVEGDTTFTLIGFSTDLPSVVGSHAEWPAKGKFVRIRVVATNTGRSTVLFDSRRQVLLTADGAAYPPDSQAMLIKRQPTTFDLGAGVRIEFDLYYDVPANATPSGLRVFGGPTFTDATDQVGTDIPLPRH